MTVHLVTGDDPVLRADALASLIEELLAGTDRTLALEEFEVPGRAGGDEEGGGGADARLGVVEAVVNAASTPPFMTERRVVVLRDVGLLKAADLEPLVRSLDDLLPTTELVLVGGGGKTPKAIEDSVKRDGTAHAPDVTKGTDVLARELDAAGVTLRPDAAKSVLEHVGNDAGMIPGIVDTLAAAYGGGPALDATQVAPYLTGQGSVPVWDLTNAIEKGDTPTALAVLHRMLTVTSPMQPKPMHPLQLLGVLHSQYRKLLALDDPEVRSAEDAARALGGRTSPNAARFRLRQARALGTDGLRHAFDHLARADLDLKGERAIPEQVVMELLVARLADLSARSGAGTAGDSRKPGGRRARV